ncbi:hypothetical protein J2W49_004653 [Hydrogenophaga palleronii]|uniref:Uncharacterized protein n=1 Tax=Hydrogenophaga palleronii TaxID=65655 RepID=A0ABU1WTQ9_9BURK|nr:hypothetical protein [Hydrogenophaga palleronii]
MVFPSMALPWEQYLMYVPHTFVNHLKAGPGAHKLSALSAVTKAPGSIEVQSVSVTFTRHCPLLPHGPRHGRRRANFR